MANLGKALKRATKAFVGRMVMKLSTIIVLLLVWGSSGVHGQGDLPDFLPDLCSPGSSVRDRVTSPSPLRPDPILEFHRAVTTLAEGPNHIRLRSLYWPEAADSSIAADMQRWADVLSDGAHQKRSFIFKDVDRLPERAREAWSRTIAGLTSYEASVLCVVRIGNRVQVMFPLRRTGDGLLIVPADRILGDE
jgi:hypothetical protein